jgi:hypothetical protein
MDEDEAVEVTLLSDVIVSDLTSEEEFLFGNI